MNKEIIDIIDNNIILNDIFYNPYYFGYSQDGIFKDVTIDDWHKAAYRLMQSIIKIGNGVPYLEATAPWYTPLFLFLEKENIKGEDIIDIGCELGIPLWDAVLNNSKNIVGIDMVDNKPNYFLEKIKYIQCQILDLQQIYNSLNKISHVGGILNCTEVLEHLPYNSVSSFILFCQNIKPDYLYFTTPTFLYPDGFLKPWQHYKTLPMWQGQFLGDQPHVKSWESFEIEEFICDLGYKKIGSFRGYYRIGVIAGK